MPLKGARTQFRSHPWVGGVLVLEPPPAASGDVQQQKLELEAVLGLKPRHFNMGCGPSKRHLHQ